MTIRRILPKDESILGKLQKVNERERQAPKFAEWLYKNGSKKTLSHNDCAEMLAKMLDKDITNPLLAAYVTIARLYLETTYKATIWNVRGEGWRVATEEEKAIYMIRSARNAISRAQRTVRLYSITEEKYIPGAVEKVFGKYSNAKERIKEYQNKFNSLFDQKQRRNLLNATSVK